MAAHSGLMEGFAGRTSLCSGSAPDEQPTERSLLAMQNTYDLWIARQHVDLQQVGKLAFT